jgi:hypothetical protein
MTTLADVFAYMEEEADIQVLLKIRGEIGRMINERERGKRNTERLHRFDVKHFQERRNGVRRPNYTQAHFWLDGNPADYL